MYLYMCIYICTYTQVSPLFRSKVQEWASVGKSFFPAKHSSSEEGVGHCVTLVNWQEALHDDSLRSTIAWPAGIHFPFWLFLYPEVLLLLCLLHERTRMLTCDARSSYFLQNVDTETEVTCEARSSHLLTRMLNCDAHASELHLTGHAIKSFRLVTRRMAPVCQAQMAPVCEAQSATRLCQSAKHKWRQSAKSNKSETGAENSASL